MLTPFGAPTPTPIPSVLPPPTSKQVALFYEDDNAVLDRLATLGARELQTTSVRQLAG